VREANVHTTSTGHRKRVLRGQRSASGCAICNCHGAGMHAAGENLREDGNSSFFTEREAWAEQIRERSATRVDRERLVDTCACELQLAVIIAANVRDERNKAVEVECQRSAAAVEANHSVANSSRARIEPDAEARVAKKKFYLWGGVLSARIGVLSACTGLRSGR
jgi:hypothetical protein